MHEVLESFSGSAFAVNERGEIVDANDAAGQLFQWPVNMFMPMKLDWLISEFVDDRYGHIATFSQLLETDAFRARRGSIEMIGKTLTGRKFVAELSCMPARNDESRVIVFIRERIGVAYEEERPVVSASAI